MAYFRKRGRRWRAEVERVGARPLSRSFPTKAAAAAWALEVEAEILAGRHGVIVPRSLAQALQRYAREISPTKRGARWERVRLAKLEGELGCAGMLLEDVRARDLAAWRDRALAGRRDPDGGRARRPLAAASVRREMALLRSVLERARREWGWIRTNPLQDVDRPANTQPRQRVYAPAEAVALLAALGYAPGTPAVGVSARVGAAFALSLATGMRSGELLALTWADVDLEARSARLVISKNGDARFVPLSRAALAILADLPRPDPLEGSVFGLSAESRDVLFRRARDAAGIVGGTFHDARATFITRNAPKLHMLEMARVVGQRDPRSLMVYYRESPAVLAAKLD